MTIFKGSCELFSTSTNAGKESEYIEIFVIVKLNYMYLRFHFCSCIQ